MSHPLSPRQEPSSTYIVQDRRADQEFHSQYTFDQVMTAGMGGILPEQPDPTIFQQILDIGCGTGHWLIETASTYLTASQLVGIDTNERMLNYARTQAAAQKVSERVQFRVMDARHVLQFPSDSFNLVNQRQGTSYLRTWDWPDFLKELQRITLPGGIIRFTETRTKESNSPALNQLIDLLVQALYQSGHISSQKGNKLVATLIQLMKQLDIQNIQTCNSSFNCQGGTSAGESFAEEMKHTLRLFQPFIFKWVRVDNYEKLYQQALNEMQQPDFVGKWNFITIWGTNRK